MIEDKLSQDLIIFPNKLSQRRYEQNIALKNGFCNKSNFLTFEAFKNKIFSTSDSFFNVIPKSEKLLISIQLIENFKKINCDGSMNRMNNFSCFYILQKIENEISNLPYCKNHIIEWMKNNLSNNKLNQIGLLYSLWDDYCYKHQIMNNVKKNQIILDILTSKKNKWPFFLKNKNKIIFQDVLWIEPFQEECILKMNSQINIEIESGLPITYVEYFSERLNSSVISNKFKEKSITWTEDLCDAIIVNDSSICNEAIYDHIDFSNSLNPYGEIEDIARRIRWHVEHNNYSFNDIAIVVPSLSLVDDIIPHVFKRFNLTYYYDKGRPILSSPIIKLFISYLSISISKSRDAILDFLRNPSLKNNHEELIKIYQKEIPTVDVVNEIFINNLIYVDGKLLLEKFDNLIKEPCPNEDHFNFTSYKKLKDILIELMDKKLTLHNAMEVIIESLKNINILPKIKRDDGINILSFNDVDGVDYKLVCFVALNEGLFPSIKTEDALFDDHDKSKLKLFLQKKLSRFPEMALTTSKINIEKQRIRFFSAILSASHHIVFSCRKLDNEGVPQQPSSYFTELWNLFGTSNKNNFRISKYDKWRIKNSEDSFLSDYFNSQKKLNYLDRSPMIGESHLAFVPKGLSYTFQEIFINTVSKYKFTENKKIPGSYSNLIKGINIQQERTTSKEDDKFLSIFSGHIQNQLIIEKINKWINSKKSFSSTLLEKLAYSRFVFLLEEILGIKNEELLDDFTDKRLRGTIVHEILNKIYTDLRDKDCGLNIDKRWVYNDGKNWKLSRQKTSKNCYPVFNLDSSKKDKVVQFLNKEIDNIFNHVMANLDTKTKSRVGRNEFWNIEQKKIKEYVISVVKFDFDSSENHKIFPFKFEFKFGPETETKLNIFNLPISGKIDRIDLCFDENDILSEVHVVDYKSNSDKKEQVKEIKKAANCQLMIYAFAVQQFLFNTFNDDKINKFFRSMNFPYSGKKPNIKDFRTDKFMISLNSKELVDEFIISLKNNINKIRVGDFSTEPYFKNYNNYEAILRNNASKLLDD